MDAKSLLQISLEIFLSSLFATLFLLTLSLLTRLFGCQFRNSVKVWACISFWGDLKVNK